MKAFPANRLAKEKSPYLLQHAHNPVDWFPWGAEAFDKAKNENKPIFLSIGYSTCHWCHVMERESFEDERIAKVLNDHFVAIKVDREERPDIDSIHMAVVTSLTGSGGWPLSVFLTPDKKPFFGGTYFPPQPRWGSPGFYDLLKSIVHNWGIQEDKIRESGASIIQALQQRFEHAPVAGHMPTSAVLTKAYLELKENFDMQNGGFGHAPKFPMGHTLSFLLRYWKATQESPALAMVEKTLLTMSNGGIYDQLGGGFHRYSTDAIWQVPHFEKMLYDQALLSKTYLEAYQATGNYLFARTAKDIFAYVLHDLKDLFGGFYSAEDADSLEPGSPNTEEKKEGAFYLWSEAELKSRLTPDEFAFFQSRFAIMPGGNAQFDPHGEFVGKNVLHAQQGLEEDAQQLEKPFADLLLLWASAKNKLLNLRAQRLRPHRDNKILTDWNSLMISSLVFGGRILEEPRYVAAAEAGYEFIMRKLRRSDGRLLHRYYDSDSAVLAGLEDYAFLIQALLDLFENTFEPMYLQEAVRLNDEMIELFWDEKAGGLFLTPKDGEDLFLRPKEIYDGAVPSGNSIAALNLLRLYHFTFEEKYLKYSEGIFLMAGSDVEHRPSAYSQMLMALQFFFSPIKEIVVAGELKNDAGEKILNLIFKSWLPHKVVVVKTPSTEGQIEQMLPFTRAQKSKEGVLQVFVCENQTCQSPVSDLEQLKKILL